MKSQKAVLLAKDQAAQPLFIDRGRTQSVHPVLIVFVAELTKLNEFSVGTGKHDGRMRHAVEHRCLNRRIVEHVFKDDVLSHFQLMVERPATHEVATEAGVAAQTINISLSFTVVLIHDSCPTDVRMIGHLQAVGHMASETYVEDSCLNAMVLHNILHLTHQRSRLPSEGTSRLQDHMKPRIALVEAFQCLHQQVTVVVLSSHQMTATKIDPFQLTEPTGEFLFDMH